jgi:transposase
MRNLISDYPKCEVLERNIKGAPFGPAGDSTPVAVWFAYSPDREGEHPQSHLSNFTGTLQAEGYAGLDQIYAAGRVQEAACWAHVPRKFYDLEVPHKSPVAAEALRTHRAVVCH